MNSASVPVTQPSQEWYQARRGLRLSEGIACPQRLLGRQAQGCPHHKDLRSGP